MRLTCSTYKLTSYVFNVSKYNSEYANTEKAIKITNERVSVGRDNKSINLVRKGNTLLPLL